MSSNVLAEAVVKFKAWCSRERVGRIEEGTSQDVMPTNGDVLFAGVLWGAVWLAMVLVVTARMR